MLFVVDCCGMKHSFELEGRMLQGTLGPYCSCRAQSKHLLKIIPDLCLAVEHDSSVGVMGIDASGGFDLRLFVV